jgi:hypothetical protein
VWGLGVSNAAGRVLAAAAGPVQQAAQELKLPQGMYAFKLLGKLMHSAGLMGFGVLGVKCSRQGAGSSTSRAGAACGTGAETAAGHVRFRTTG